MMQTVLPSEFKRGMDLMVGGAPEVLEEFHFSGTAQTKPKLHARLRHLKTGRLTEHTFAESERVPIADAQYRRVQFSYHHGENYVFSDVETFEELTLSAEQIGERRLFIKENEEYRALFIDSRLVDITVPTIVTLEVVDAAGPIRGGSDAAWKPAPLDTGLEIMVPLFIARTKKSAWIRPGANMLDAKARRGSKGKIKTYRVQEDMKRETSGARRTKECLLCHAKDEKDRYPCFYL